MESEETQPVVINRHLLTPRTIGIIVLTSSIIFAIVWFVWLEKSEKVVQNEPISQTTENQLPTPLPQQESPVTASSNGIYNLSVEGLSEEQLIQDYGYTKDTEHVYYNGTIVVNADPNTFTQVHSGIFKDKNSAFVSGKVVEGMDLNVRFFAGPLFKNLESFRYYVDANHVWYLEGNTNPGMLIDSVPFKIRSLDGVDVSTFEIIPGTSFARDNKQLVSQWGEILAGSDPNEFEIIHHGKNPTGYKKDNLHVYARWNGIIPKADPKTSNVYGDSFMESFLLDAEDVFLDGKLIDVLDSRTFTAIEDSRYVKDKEDVLFVSSGAEGQLTALYVEGADPKTFTVMPSSDPMYPVCSGFKVGQGIPYLAKDKNQIYMDWMPLGHNDVSKITLRCGTSVSDYFPETYNKARSW